jgi:MFS family permease
LSETASVQPISARDLRISLRYVILAVCFGMVFFTVTNGPALTGYARKLGANDLVFSLLMALPALGGVVQIFASYLLERSGDRKRFFLVSPYPQRLVWIGVALIPVVVRAGTSRIIAAIALICISGICGSVGNVAFMSWMGDLVPGHMRGRFFGTRSMLSTAAAVVTAWSVGWSLDRFPGFAGYGAVFATAAVFGAVDIAFFHFIREPPMNRSEDSPRLSQVLFEPFRSKAFARFVTFWCSAMFGQMLMGPFTTVYLLEILLLDFTQVSLYMQVIPNIAIFLAARQWGRMIDRYGCKPVLTVAMTVQTVLPCLWILTSANRWWLLMPVSFVSGFFWSAMDLGAVNMLIRSSPDRNRSAYVANYSLLSGVLGNAVPYLTAGAFLSIVHPIAESLNMTILGSQVTRFHLLFLLSGLVRLVVLLLVLPRLDDPQSRETGEMLRESLRFRLPSAVRSR